MSGAVALHGGGEFLAGDEPFLAALLDLAGRRTGGARPIRVTVVPTAAARGRPESAAAHGRAAFERVASASGLWVDASAVAVIDAASAADPDLAARLAAADLVHLPGGDPDLIPTVLNGSTAWAAIKRAWTDGAVLAGASAGAMTLAAWTWTPAGGIASLGIVPGLVVMPHADGARWTSMLDRFGSAVPSGLGALGLAERTGVISEDLSADPITWRVVGPGEVRWLAVLGGRTVIARAGDTFETARSASS